MEKRPERELSPVEIGRNKYIASLTPEKRKEKARKAALARHNKNKLLLHLKEK